jgi:hypothetical protein
MQIIIAFLSYHAVKAAKQIKSLSSSVFCERSTKWENFISCSIESLSYICDEIQIIAETLKIQMSTVDHP